MVTSSTEYNNWIQNPDSLNQDHLEQLIELSKEYPFCSTTKMLYSKALRNTESVLFNNQIRITAAYAGDRNRLFKLITEKPIIGKPIEVKNKKVEKLEEIKEELKIGSPLPFEADEKHSFQEWLKLSKTKTLNLKEGSNNKSLDEKIGLIDSFLDKQPKLKVKKEAFYSPIDKAKESALPDMTFVTETLARVYLEQGHYSKAKKAYQELCLKYPQKSSLFATQIELIEKLIIKN